MNNQDETWGNLLSMIQTKDAQPALVSSESSAAEEPGEEEDVIHLVNQEMDWLLRETANGMLTDGHVSENLQRDRVRQIVQWLRHFPDRLPQMKALTMDGDAALRRVVGRDRKDGGLR